jgi:transposase-like protein
LKCNRIFLWKLPNSKINNEKHWFKLWVSESYSTRQLVKLSGYSKSKLERIKNYWLNREPVKEQIDLSKYKYVLFDGTYFHKNGCLICLKDSISHRILSSIYVVRESYVIVHPWFRELRTNGLAIKYIAMDGERSIMRAVQDVWPEAKIQRCLYHIQREGMRWLRTYPKTLAGQQLRHLLRNISATKTVHDKELFIANFKAWHKEHHAHIKLLPSSTMAFRDLKKTITLITNALPDMFHFLDTKHIPSTTNLIEGFFSRLKSDYRRHRGISEKHKISYLKWYCFFKNTNLF